MTRRRVRIVCGLAALIAVVCADAYAQHTPRRILLLYSYEREFSHATFAGLFRPQLARTSPDPIDFIEVSLKTVRTSRTASDDTSLDELRRTLGGTPLDLVVTLGGPSARFVQQHKTELFPSTPVLITGVDSRFLEGEPLPPGATAITVKHDPRLVLDTILRLLPDTRTVAVVVGASPVEEFWLEELKRAFRPLEPKIAFVWTNEMSFSELISRARTLPPRSAILYGVWSLDARGMPQMEDQTLDALHAAANAPMFGLHSHQLGRGIVGGPLLSMDGLAHDSATVALRLLGGERPEQIAPQTQVASTRIFDARELQRWGISESLLEPGSVVRFREPGTWERYRGLILVATAVAGAQLVLAIVLGVKLARRRRMGTADFSGLKVAEETLSRLSQRLMQAREHERAVIARAINDDVCQQLAALTHQLHAIGVESEGRSGKLRLRIEELCGQFWTLEREILAISDPLYHKLSILGLPASARPFCERRCAESSITLNFAAGQIPDLPNTISLALFRVLEEAVANAIGHGRTPHLAVSLYATREAVTLDVEDAGVGFDADAALRRGALGLVGMRERMRLVGGIFRITSERGAGTKVHASVPFGAVPPA